MLLFLCLLGAPRAAERIHKDVIYASSLAAERERHVRFLLRSSVFLSDSYPASGRRETNCAAEIRAMLALAHVL